MVKRMKLLKIDAVRQAYIETAGIFKPAFATFAMASNNALL